MERARSHVAKLKAYSVVVFAASAMAFAALLIAFLVVLAVAGLDAADEVWSGVYPVVAWLIALIVCSKFMTR